jgi:ribosomal protein S18 acetylase RimI-like enzyme
VPEAPDEEYRHRVRWEIKRFNDRGSPAFAQARTPEHRALQLDAYVVDAQGQLVAGLVGTARFWWTGRGGLEIDELWVDEPFRRRGYGRQLVGRAEDEARRRGCAFAHVHTFSFQARELYERLGYRVIGQLDEYAPGVTLYWLKKNL